MSPRPLALALAPGLAVAILTRHASAQTYRLRADAHYATSEPIAGLLVVQGEARRPSWAEAEALVWMGTGDRPGDVLVSSVRLHDPSGRGELRAGRFLMTAGGLRPLHLDGADVTARAPWGTSLEVFGGIPVAPAGEPRDFDWAVGQRLGQRVGDVTSVGVSYLQVRSTGVVAYEELGLDAAAQPTRWLDGAFSGAFDLLQPGLADARLSVAGRAASVRVEVFAARRAPSHLLPATSLFSALGDVPSQRIGSACRVHAAPRLDVLGEAAIESLGGDLGAEWTLRSTLRLDDRGDSALGLELRRQEVEASPSGVASDATWTGVRGTARTRFTEWLSASTELELAIPGNPRGRGSMWPWGLVALQVKPASAWEVAGALEASASPTATSALAALFRVSRAWEGP